MQWLSTADWSRRVGRERGDCPWRGPGGRRAVTWLLNAFDATSRQKGKDNDEQKLENRLPTDALVVTHASRANASRFAGEHFQPRAKGLGSKTQATTLSTVGRLPRPAQVQA